MARNRASAQPASSSSSQAAETASTENQAQAAAPAPDADAASAAAPEKETGKQTAEKAKKAGKKADEEHSAADLAPVLGEMRHRVKAKDGRRKAVLRAVTEADILSFRQNGDEVSVVTADGHRHALKLGELA